MATLKNDFSWSYSRHLLFQECKKKYWYNYYGSWGGWPKTPYDTRTHISPLAQHLYMLKNMQTYPQFVGTVVHETIEQILQQGKKALQQTTKEALIQKALIRFDFGIQSSKNIKWKQSPKKFTNLFEHYYSRTEELDEAHQIDSCRNKITTSLSNWWDSEIVQKLIKDERSDWLSVEELNYFLLPIQNSHSPIKVIVVIDFALQWKRSNTPHPLIIFDWKTGLESEKTHKQLLLYALFAEHSWKIPHDQIILTPFYLFKNSYTKIGFQQSELILQQDIDEVIQDIEKSAIVMLKPFEGKVHSEHIEPSEFPYTDDRTKCKACSFQEVCQKAEYQEKSRSELEKLFTLPELSFSKPSL